MHDDAPSHATDAAADANTHVDADAGVETHIDTSAHVSDPASASEVHDADSNIETTTVTTADTDTRVSIGGAWDDIAIAALKKEYVTHACADLGMQMEGRGCAGMFKCISMDG